ncbi:Transmembrane protein 136 [Hondaea fermentalgiana]|uniref:Transmembrane protein 136 n=1 Tax=Hondaea fermentalgiana TaxID=2315210 RepID=A0A2R5G5Q1_9STRA|nr:Transmembrane protein 136 [Hondaea fermentalgiana]|eukprot:GBG26367.1 Transmembrane protein 136 [Hondaea fermentalgiana]
MVLAVKQATTLTLSWALRWIALFMTCNKAAELELEGNDFAVYANRVVSMIHAAFSAVLAGKAALYYDGQGFLTYNLQGPNEPWHEAFLPVVAGYMVYDMLWELMHSKSKPDLLVYAHHILVAVTCWWSLWTGEHGKILAMTTFLSELTTPFLSAKYLLKHHKMADETLGLANDAVFALGFLFFRCFWGSIFTLTVLLSGAHPFIMAGGMAMQSINYTWGLSIGKKIARFAKGDKADRHKSP